MKPLTQTEILEMLSDQAHANPEPPRCDHCEALKTPFLRNGRIRYACNPCEEDATLPES